MVKGKSYSALESSKAGANYLPKSFLWKIERIIILFFLLFAFSVQADSPQLLIVEVQIAPRNNDFIKIYNQTDNELDISGYKLRKRTSTGSESSIRVLPTGSKISAKGYFLWANSENNFHLTVQADSWSKATLAKNNSIAILNPDNMIVDALSWGESQNPFLVPDSEIFKSGTENTSFPENPSSNQQLRRKKINDTYQNTNNNRQDFYLYPPTEALQQNVENIIAEDAQGKTQLENSKATSSPSNIITSNSLLATQKTDEKIDINTASVKDLQKIAGVGEVLAQRITEARPFYSLNDLSKVKGIGEKTLEDIKKQGLAWVNPNLEPPKNKEEESYQETLATVAKPLQREYLTNNGLKSSPVLLIALGLAAFSGGIILTLKHRLKKGYNQNA